MQEFNVIITETLDKVVSVTATSPEMALKMVQDMYHEEDIVLDYADFTGVDFVVEE